MTATDTLERSISATPLEAARALAPRIRALSAQTEKDRRVPPDLVGEMARAGMFRMFVPRKFGGLESDPASALRVVEEVAAADGATGWCLMIGSTTGVFAAFLPEETSREIWGANPEAITGGSFAPRGRAVPVEGGYRVSGRWSWGSGSQHCDWLFGGCMIFDAADGPPRMGPQGPQMLAAVFPQGEAEIIDTWDSSGLRGTGSHDFEVKDLFVPSEHTFAHFAQPPVQTGPLYSIPLPGLLPTPHAAMATGIARAAIDEFVKIANSKTPMGTRSKLRERELVQANVGKAEATLRSARAFVYEAVGEVWETALSGDPVTPRQAATLQLAATHATHRGAEVVDAMYTAAGGTAVYSASPLQRMFRDIHVATSHVLVTPDKYMVGGKALLDAGLPDGEEG